MRSATQQLTLFRALAPVEAPDKNEWYTPADIMLLARRVLGEIDLDPASTERANRVIRATRYYTERDNGLAHDWRGRVWLNPPYSPTPGAWVDKLISEYECGNVTAAILLVPPKTDTGWFAPLFDYPICFKLGRIKFWGQAGDSNTFGSAFVYLGPDMATFAREFGQIGAVMVGVHDATE